MSEWIDVKDQLPSPGVTVIVRAIDQGILAIFNDYHTGTVWCQANDPLVTHWMEIPPLPAKQHYCNNGTFVCYSDPYGFLLKMPMNGGDRYVNYCLICGEKSPSSNL